MPSFDVVSKVALHEVDNAVQQAAKEIGTRYDFRGTDTKVEHRKGEGIILISDSPSHVDAARGVLHDKLTRRNVPLKSLDAQRVEPAGGKNHRQLIKLQQGIGQDKAKLVVKFLKDTKLKVQTAIQGESLRVTGKSRDDLQAAIAQLKTEDFGVPLQFENFRD